jgi:GxxExxY protein
LKHEDLTREIIRACFVVANELGAGFVESVYHRALIIALHEQGLNSESQVPLQVSFHGHVVGEFVADIVVERTVLLELKAVKALQREHQAQLINYLNATGMEIGLLINFGTPKPEIKRCHCADGRMQ